MPLNTHLAFVTLRLDGQPMRPVFPAVAPDDAANVAAAPDDAANVAAARVANKARRGRLAVLPDDLPQNLHVGVSKGSISGNWAMEESELLIVIGSRAVCQADCSGTGWPRVGAVINLNADPVDVQHYSATLAFAGGCGNGGGPFDCRAYVSAAGGGQG